MRLKQFPSTPIDTTDGSYNMEDDIIVQKNDIDEYSIISDSFRTSSSSRRRSDRSRTKERQKKRHGPKNKRIKWCDKKLEQLNFLTSQNKSSSIPTDPVNRFNSQIRGIPIEVESELQALIPRTSNMALDEKVTKYY